MARPPKIRLIAEEMPVRYYKPRGLPMRELMETTLSMEGLEALRLFDLEGMSQESAAGAMNISKATFCRVLKKARLTVTQALLNGWALRIEGGHFTAAQAEKDNQTAEPAQVRTGRCQSE